jgi:aminoglycoside phosphotransferase (APT) family kinase protein
MPAGIGALVGAGKVAEVFEYGGAEVLKLYREGGIKSPPFREGAILSLLEAAGLPAPRVVAVSQFGERWGVVMSRISGPQYATFLAGEQRSAAHLDVMARVQIAMHKVVMPQLPSLKSRLAANIMRTELLDARQKASLLSDLAGLPDDNRLCHGDFHPWNVMGDLKTPIVVDWLDATAGSPLSDLCRSYVLMSAASQALAEDYVEAYASLAELDVTKMWSWLRVVAGARLAEHVPAEEARLLAIVGDGL